MSRLNTIFNGGSLYYNRRTAQASEATSRAATQLATADRHRDLRERGLISHRSTAAEIAKVEHRLAAQMRARDALTGHAPPRHPYVEVVAAAVALPTMAASMALGSGFDRGVPAILFLIVLAAVLAVHLPLVRARERRRTETIARADWNSRGVCRWCRSSEAHLVDGEEEHPRVAHAVAVEKAIGR